MLVHLHIPKTGGTSVRHLLAKNYGDGFYGCRPQAMSDPIWRKAQQERDRVTCLSGHLVYGLGRFFSSAPYYIVFLRDPVRRLLSLYHYLWIKNGGRRPPEEAGMSLEDFVSSNTWACNDNDQVRFLAGYPYRGGNDRNGSKMTKSAYRAALKNLRQCYYVGTTETLQDDIKRLGVMLNWEHTQLGHSLREPKRVKKEDLDSALIDKIIESQAYDMDLYYEAQELRGR